MNLDVRRHSRRPFRAINEEADVVTYIGAFLPGQLFTGAGVGLVMPSLSAVAGLSLPARRWGTGSALINAARQVGMVVGTTALALIYEQGIDMTSIRRGWMFLAAAAGAAALLAATLAVRWPNPTPQLSER